MKLLITGVNGQLGFDVYREAEARGLEPVGSGSTPNYHGILPLSKDGDGVYIPMNVTNPAQVEAVFAQVKPDVVVHCSAWTKVDDAENPVNREKVEALNSKAPAYIAQAAKTCGAKLFFFSTDYIFDGKGTHLWDPDESPANPLNVYGATKLEGERAVQDIMEEAFILRISWVYGLNGANFVKTMLRLAENHDRLTVVCDQIGRPTYTPDLAKLILDMAATEAYGVYHVSNEGDFVSWCDFAKEIFRQSGKNVDVVPVTTEEYGVSAAARPENSRLDTSKLTRNGLTLLPDWKDALGRFLYELQEVESRG